MTEALTIARSTAGSLTFNPEQRKMIRDMYANGASETEFAALIAIAEARGLNPLLKQVYFVKRWDSNKRCEVWAVQGSIDGLRAIAQRTGLYDGQDEPEFEYEGQGKLKLARVRVYRKDWSRPAVGIAHWSEYAQTKKDGGLTSFWAGKGHIMLAKCAEALGLRKAFPEDMGGIYVPEEMGDSARADAAKDVTPRKPLTGHVSDDAPAAKEPPHDPATGEVVPPISDGAGLAVVLHAIEDLPAFHGKPEAEAWWKAHQDTIRTLTPAEQGVVRRALSSKVRPDVHAA